MMASFYSGDHFISIKKQNYTSSHQRKISAVISLNHKILPVLNIFQWFCCLSVKICIPQSQVSNNIYYIHPITSSFKSSPSNTQIPIALSNINFFFTFL